MTKLKVPVSSEDHVHGPETAEITLVEYGDYECSHCAFAYPVVKRIQQHFGKRIRLVFRNFPLTESHPNAEAAAETAEFAGAHGKFWEMHDLLYENQPRLSWSAPPGTCPEVAAHSRGAESGPGRRTVHRSRPR